GQKARALNWYVRLECCGARKVQKKVKKVKRKLDGPCKNYRDTKSVKKRAATRGNLKSGRSSPDSVETVAVSLESNSKYKGRAGQARPYNGERHYEVKRERNTLRRAKEI